MSALRRRLSLGLALASLIVSAGAAAESPDSTYAATDTGPSPEAITGDLLVVRPIGFAATLLGAGIFLAGLPFEAATGNFSGPAKALIGRPAKFTFQRPIGENP